MGIGFHIPIRSKGLKKKKKEQGADLKVIFTYFWCPWSRIMLISELQSVIFLSWEQTTKTASANDIHGFSPLRGLFSLSRKFY